MRKLIVFARRPVEGRVKTRLSPALPARLACALYAAMLSDAFEAVAGARADERIVRWAEESGDVPPGFVAARQSDGDLGTRIVEAFEAYLLAREDRVVIVGSDTPALTAAAIEDAFQAMEAADLVLGPATDGGYWLVGMTRVSGAPFEGVAWSTASVLAQTEQRAREAGLRVARVATLDDVDEPADVARLVARIARPDAVCGPHTRATLHEMGLLA